MLHVILKKVCVKYNIFLHFEYICVNILKNIYIKKEINKYYYDI